MPPKTVKCFVRTKPTSVFPKEVLELQSDGHGIVVHLRRQIAAQQQTAAAPSNQPDQYGFIFDGVLHDSTQQTVYDAAAADVVLGALDGFNGTVMCYGQTGAGKTFTTTGATESFEHRGLIPRAIAHLFKEVRARSETATVVRVSYVEVYNEKIYDLIGTGSSSDEEGLKVAEDAAGNTVIRGARVEACTTEEEALRWLFEGETNRTIAEHSMNVRSSRSHCVFTLHLEMRSLVESVERVVTSKLHFVDLAGSERLAKTHSQGDTMREAMYINKSLTFLEQVIVALADKKKERVHVPYRQSRLTSILRDSLGGNCRTTLIANIRCEPEHVEETVATLRFAARMALINNTAVANIQYDPVQLLHKAEREIRDLKAELAMHDQIAGRSHVQYDASSDEQQAQLRARIRAYIRGDADELDFATLRQMREIIVQFRNVAREIDREATDRIKAATAAASVAQSTTAIPSSSVDATSGSHSLALPQPSTSTKETSQSQQQSARRATGTIASRKSLQGKAQDADTAETTQGRPQSSQQTTQLPPLDQRSRATTPKGPRVPGGEDPSATTQPGNGGEKDKEKDTTTGDKHRSKSRKDKKKPTATTTEKPRRKRHGKSEEVEETVAETQPAASAEQQQQQQPPSLTSTTQQPVGEEAATANAATANAAPLEPPKPADKNAAFEVFKQHRGRETHTVLVENKRQLRLRRKSLLEAADSVNTLKREIDTLRTLLQQKREARRLKAPEVDAAADTEEEVIDEEEFEAMKRLKECKQLYREGFEQVGRLRADVEYLVGSIDQCRQRLLADFEAWFGESTTTTSSLPTMVEEQPDFEEAFDRVQQERLEEKRRQDPEAAAYFSAMAKAKKK